MELDQLIGYDLLSSGKNTKQRGNRSIKNRSEMIVINVKMSTKSVEIVNEIDFLVKHQNHQDEYNPRAETYLNTCTHTHTHKEQIHKQTT